MKKKFDLKLTACLVSLFIGFLILVFLNEHKSGLFCGLILLAVSLFLFARTRTEKIDNILKLTAKELDEELESDEPTDEEIIEEVYKEVKKIKKQRKSINFTFNLCSILLVIMAIFVLI